MNIIIRQEKVQDINEVYHLIQKSFENAEHSDHDEHNLVNRLRSSTKFIPELSLVAEYENKIVGHILFTEILVGDQTLVALAPVAVLPEMQSKGIGKLLIIEGHKIARQLGYKGAVVLGHDKYYPKFGYKKASQYGIKAPFEVSDANFMAIELMNGGLSDVQGVVEYAKEFFGN
ncbi:GNAT family N-acetyltransferase [Paenibacillus sp. VTT E-133280]|jgi:predicted N-acetyltransferase YhbS|uniref:GNAT family N-acetyltransferase n=1 Tax=Paenibacillus TaxID=44249 RepID=UPI000BA0D0A5|nr:MULTISPECIES: N-acetyltransferase [unclassified Paenibacillus]MDH6368830.1 putative N-acetyltransferase YhbS [Paenibacillus sp. PastF-3]OZQ69317.1 GNAT family N-acetyltransferase [Paenibacillus sp. VTT E-133280]OZQ98649.1 GNAT family N-acetyltransferase [Paenibacillus sp. VTT E-133291]